MNFLKSFKAKLIFILIILMVVPLAIYGFITIRNNVNKIEETTYNENLVAAENLAIETNNILQESENLLKIASESDGIKSMIPTKMMDVSKELVNTSDYIENVYIMNKKGMQVYKTTGDKGDRSDREYFQKAIEGEANFSDIIMSRSRGVPIVVYALPIKRGSSVVGVLGASIDLGILSEMVKERSPGETGISFIVDDSGKTIAHPNEEYVLEMEDLSNLTPVQSVANGEKGTKLYESEEGEKLSAYAPIEKTGWGAVVELSSEEAFSEIQNEIWYAIMIIGITIVIGSIIAYYLGNSITKPVLAALGQAEIIANGDLTNEVDKKYLNRKDELGDLAKAIEKMRNNLKHIVGNLSSISDEVASSSQELSSSSEEISASAEQVGTAIQEVASGAEEQSAQIDETRDSVSDLANKIDEVSDMAENMDKQADDVMENIKMGDDSVDDSIKQVQQVKEESNEVSKRITELGDLSQEIGDIIELISGISDQTNLLALNAAIEAARAGEAGRGFSVVADEIRELAEESSDATEKIAGLINEIQNRVDDTIAQMDRAEKAVETSVNTIQETDQSFTEINSAAENLKNLIDDIALAAKDMADKSSDVSASVEEIAAVSEEASSNAEEVAASSEEQSASTQEIVEAAERLEEMAQKLSESIEQFKI
ncbi:MAG: methyl-accepting chemotaxis protein [Bacillota bacterium]